MTYQVLIIDDDEGAVKTLSKILERNKIEVDASFNINDGLAKIAHNEYDVILLDVNFPKGNGIETISTILDRNFPPQVIIMTGFSNPDGAQLAIDKYRIFNS